MHEFDLLSLYSVLNCNVQDINMLRMFGVAFGIHHLDGGQITILREAWELHLQSKTMKCLSLVAWKYEEI